jgi:hypothetical protein
MSFITKDQFTVGIVLFFGRIFTSLLYIFKEKIWIQMLFTRWFHLVNYYIFAAKLFSGNQIWFFDSNSLRMVDLQLFSI